MKRMDGSSWKDTSLTLFSMDPDDTTLSADLFLLWPVWVSLESLADDGRSRPILLLRLGGTLLGVPSLLEREDRDLWGGILGDVLAVSSLDDNWFSEADGGDSSDLSNSASRASADCCQWGITSTSLLWEPKHTYVGFFVAKKQKT